MESALVSPKNLTTLLLTGTSSNNVDDAGDGRKHEARNSH